MSNNGNPTFALGQIVATPGALEALEKNGQSVSEFLRRHARCDWGDADAEDAEANNLALSDGSRLLSSYRLKDGSKLWVITEADRSSSCCLLPSEY